MDSSEKLPLFLLILCLSLLNNLLIPFAIYFRQFGRKGYRGQGGCNAGGVIMDGVLAGLINLLALNLLFEIGPRLLFRDLALAFLVGFLSMVSAHVFMSLRRWEVWIMPRPGRWNKGGYWHMVSMTLQMGFLFYPALLLFQDPFLLERGMVQLSLFLIFLLAGLFLLCLRRGKRDWRVGRFCLSGQAW
ncbi:MAG: hypothetical protein HY577_00420 [Candidatus Nealsonbacteria bacterium]|nr:hypothetical protein [Candidatus Nealsonbacteria bacterium]